MKWKIVIIPSMAGTLKAIMFIRAAATVRCEIVDKEYKKNNMHLDFEQCRCATAVVTMLATEHCRILCA